MLKMFLSAWTFLILTAAFTSADKKRTDEYHAQALLKWLNDEGGYFNPKVEMRRLDPSDPKSFFGMFVKEDIPMNELLFRIPRSMILDSREEDPDLFPLSCGTVHNLKEQLTLKDKSKYAPYINYLIDTQPPGVIPSGWSESAQSLFEQVLGASEGDIDVQLLLGGNPFLWLDEWYETCDGSQDPLDKYAALLVIQRCWDDILIPILDLMSHRNGKWLNIVHSDVFDKSHEIEVRAKRNIQKNEQLYSTYNRCESCGARENMYGTPDILRDYGFVEQMPQSYFLYPLNFGFRLDYQDYDETGQPIGDVVVTEWINLAPELDDIQLFKDIAAQVKEKKSTFLNVRDENITDFEWNTINTYTDALEVAFEAAAKYSIPVLIDPYSSPYGEKERFDWYDENWTESEEDDEEVEEHDEL
jgi:hypothetical protein